MAPNSELYKDGWDEDPESEQYRAWESRQQVRRPEPGTLVHTFAQEELKLEVAPWIGAESPEETARRERAWEAVIAAQPKPMTREERELERYRQQASNSQNALRPPDTQRQAEAAWDGGTSRELAERRRREQMDWTRAANQLRQENLERERRAMADAMRNAQIIGGRQTTGAVAKPVSKQQPAEVVTTAPRRIILEDE